MKKRHIFTVLAALVSLFPAISSAQVSHINGNGAGNQTLATTSDNTTMHMQIVTSGGTHTFQWDGTPWRVDQGGTGQTVFTSGALIYGNGTSPLASVTPGSAGDVLQFNGTIPAWIPVSSLGISTQPAGNDGEIQFNDGGTLGADSGFRFEKMGSPQKGDKNLNIAGNVFIGPPGDSIYFLRTGSGGSPLRQPVIAMNDSDGAIIIQPVASTAVMEIGAYDSSVATLSTRFMSTDRNYAFPNASGTFGLLEADQKWTGTNTFSKGASATTTVNFGEMGDATSHACFNTKNSAGQDMSFYFNNDFQMVIDQSPCQ